jgi:hypothetical protein
MTDLFIYKKEDHYNPIIKISNIGLVVRVCVDDIKITVFSI